MSEDNAGQPSFEEDVSVAESILNDAQAKYKTGADYEETVLCEAFSILQNRANDNPEIFTSAKFAGKYFRLEIGSLEHEVFKVAFLNNQHELIEVHTLAIGTIDQSAIYPREIAKCSGTVKLAT